MKTSDGDLSGDGGVMVAAVVGETLMPNDIDWAELDRLGAAVADPWSWTAADVCAITGHDSYGDRDEREWVAAELLAALANAYPAIKAERERLLQEHETATNTLEELADENRQLREALEKMDMLVKCDGFCLAHPGRTTHFVTCAKAVARDLLDRLKGEGDA